LKFVTPLFRQGKYTTGAVQVLNCKPHDRLRIGSARQQQYRNSKQTDQTTIGQTWWFRLLQATPPL
jgi:hypothetical protein